MLRLTAVAALLAVSLAQPLGAQLSELRLGARVRLEAPGLVTGKYEGTVLSRTADTVVVGVQDGDEVRFAVAGITQLELARGRSRRLGVVSGLKWGTPIGAVVGLIVVGETVCPEPRYGSVSPCKRMDSTLGRTMLFAAGTLAVALPGAIIGALIGREDWAAYDLGKRTSVRLQPSASGLALSFQF